MKNIKLFLVLALISFSPAAWSDAAVGTLHEPDSCIVNPSAIVAPKVHPTKKYVHLHATPQTKARAHALAALHRHEAGLLPVAINICPPTPAKVSQPVTCRSSLGASASMTGSEVSSMLVANGYNANPNSLLPAMVNAMHAHPEAAPALYAYALQHTDPNDKNAIEQISRAAYQAAPGQAAGLAYGGILSDPGQTVLITQALMASASPTDRSAILQCSVDANPNIQTGAFVPSLAQPELAAIGQNDIRNNINNGQGITTLIPGLEAREKDDSAT
jgi:hypothetical protein